MTVPVTVPFPLPFAPDVITTQGAFDDAFHAHPAGAATDALPVEPLPDTRPLGKLTEYVHTTFPACETRSRGTFWGAKNKEKKVRKVNFQATWRSEKWGRSLFLRGISSAKGGTKSGAA